jgi:hypothetical protein
MTKPVKTLNAVKNMVRNRGGHLEQCFRWGAKEWCPWIPNPKYPGTYKATASDGSWSYEFAEPKYLPQGIHELQCLLDWANDFLSTEQMP